MISARPIQPKTVLRVFAVCQRILGKKRRTITTRQAPIATKKALRSHTNTNKATNRTPSGPGMGTGSVWMQSAIGCLASSI
jgi:hypothetical protein